MMVLLIALVLVQVLPGVPLDSDEADRLFELAGTLYDEGDCAAAAATYTSLLDAGGASWAAMRKKISSRNTTLIIGTMLSLGRRRRGEVKSIAYSTTATEVIPSARKSAMTSTSPCVVAPSAGRRMIKSSGTSIKPVSVGASVSGSTATPIRRRT